jgi:choline dehydrogenase-like flavoprotein
MSCKNLKLLTNIHVDKITFKRNRVSALFTTSVKYIPTNVNKHTQMFAAKEVILAAGSVFTLHLLMYPSIGLKDVLAATSVTVKKVCSRTVICLNSH